MIKQQSQETWRNNDGEVKQTPTNASNSNQWTWSGVFEVAQAHAKELAAKAQILAEQARRAAEEKAALLQQERNEMLKSNEKRRTNSKIVRINGNLKSLSAQLELFYITENIIAMAYPFDPSRPGNAEGGNDIDVVAAYLQKKHGGHYMIWNISEETYDYSKFNDQVLEYKFPGHPAPPLGLLFKICTSVESWLDADEKNIAVIHCLTGKGRTASLIACILSWIGEFSSPTEALQYAAERRGIGIDFLTIPSQRRYVQYFSNMIDGIKPSSEPLLLRRVIINSIPIFGNNGGGPENAGCCPYVQLFKNGRLIATAVPPTDQDKPSQDGPNGSNAAGQRVQLKWIKASEGSASFQVDVAVQGDILLRCRHADSSGARISMFRAAFHTGYVPSGVLRLTKAQLDGSYSDPRFDSEFFIDIMFAPVEKAPVNSSSQLTSFGETLQSGDDASEMKMNKDSRPVGVPSDSGLLLDAATSDKYEATIHRDLTFWDTIAARKNKSKRRKPRKFLATAQDQFSIADDINEIIKIESNDVKTSQSGISDIDLIQELALAEGSMSSLEKKSSGNDSMKGNDNSPYESESTKANNELLALRELEKELGLDDFQFNKGDAPIIKKNSSSDVSNKSLHVKSDDPVTTIKVDNHDDDDDDGDCEQGLDNLIALNQSPANKSVTKSSSSSTSNAPISNSAFDDENLDELEQYLQSLWTNK
jgi:protein-tyrosine phosphatase